MIIIGLFGAAVATAALALVMFRLAGVALPFAIGLAAVFAALNRGADPLLAVILGLVLGILTLVAGQVAFARSRSLGLRVGVAAAFVIPAGVAGYSIAAGIVSLTSGSPIARLVIGLGGAVAVGWAALQHLLSGAHAIAPQPRKADLIRTNGAG